MVPPKGYERRKDPQKVRAALVAATATIIAEQGLGKLTVDAVARAAGVTKGGLFHHFPTKQDLVEGVLETMFAEAEATLADLMAADAEPHGRFTRAMLNGVFQNHRVCDTVSSRTLCLAMTADPLLQRRWADWFARQLAQYAETDENISCAIVRLATDGIWLSSLHAPNHAPPVAQDVRDALLAMTRPGP
ncbi:TetR/AcrR family transcriptional regulator [Sphingomonas sp.]|uniref:TetR/AcrR family transcriptional regulator n=1 Tax=Sphingomonas sp. TaxID=28214 RepID=UPI002DD65551|nr:TetR/AcrR family transcriptional regulator [Sphingomonas sp.]